MQIFTAFAMLNAFCVNVIVDYLLSQISIGKPKGALYAAGSGKQI
jgi:hypothetical protein